MTTTARRFFDHLKEAVELAGDDIRITARRNCFELEQRANQGGKAYALTRLVAYEQIAHAIPNVLAIEIEWMREEFKAALEGKADRPQKKKAL